MSGTTVKSVIGASLKKREADEPFATFGSMCPVVTHGALSSPAIVSRFHLSSLRQDRIVFAFSTWRKRISLRTWKLQTFNGIR